MWQHRYQVTLKTCVPSHPVISLPTIYPEQKNQKCIKDLMYTKVGITENLRVKNWEEPSITKKVSKNDSRQTMEVYTATKRDFYKEFLMLGKCL